MGKRTLRSMTLAAVLLAVFALGIAAGPSQAQAPAGLPAADVGATPAGSSLLPPVDLRATDTPNDRGSSIDLSWGPSPDEANRPGDVLGHSVERADRPEGSYQEVGRTPLGQAVYTDNSVSDTLSYYYRLRTLGRKQVESLGARRKRGGTSFRFQP